MTSVWNTPTKSNAYPPSGPEQLPQKKQEINPLGVINDARNIYNLLPEASSAASVAAPASASSAASYLPSLSSSAPTTLAPGSAILGSYGSVPAVENIPAGFEGIGSLAGGGIEVAPTTAGLSDAAVLGNSIGSGLQSLGVGANTASTLGTAAGYGIPAIAGLYSAYNIGKGLMSGRKMGTAGGAMQGAALGASIGSVVPVIGTLVGGAVGALAGGVLGQFGHGKNYWNNQDRKKAFEELFKGHPEAVQMGVGKGAGTYNFSAKQDKEVYKHEIDHSNPLSSVGIKYLKPLANFLAGEGSDDNIRGGLVRVLYNELSKGGTVTPEEMRQQALRAYSYFNVKPSDILGSLGKFKEADSEISDFKAAIDSLRPGGKPFGIDPAATVVNSSSVPPGAVQVTQPRQSATAPGMEMRGLNKPVSSMSPSIGPAVKAITGVSAPPATAPQIAMNRPTPTTMPMNQATQPAIPNMLNSSGAPPTGNYQFLNSAPNLAATSRATQAVQQGLNVGAGITPPTMRTNTLVKPVAPGIAALPGTPTNTGATNPATTNQSIQQAIPGAGQIAGAPTTGLPANPELAQRAAHPDQVPNIMARAPLVGGGAGIQNLIMSLAAKGQFGAPAQNALQQNPYYGRT